MFNVSKTKTTSIAHKKKNPLPSKTSWILVHEESSIKRVFNEKWVQILSDIHVLNSDNKPLNGY